MATNIKLLLRLSAFSAVLFLNSCGKNSIDCAKTSYNFKLDIKAVPDRDSIMAGDTIWLEINSITSLKDFNSGQIIDYSSATNLGSAISVIKLLGVNSVRDVTGSFNFYLINGTDVYNPNVEKVREYKFAEINNRYIFKLGIVPKDKGVYKLFVSNATNVYTKNDKCTKASFEINFANTNQHLYYNKIIAPQVILQPGEGIYLFKVF